jgi:hypothetical protein
LSAVSVDEGLVATGDYFLLLAPPTNAVRIKIAGTWSEVRTCENGTVFGVSYSGVIGNPTSDPPNAGLTIDTLSKTTGATVNGAALTQAFEVEWTRSGGQVDWELSRDDMLASSPIVPNSYARIAMSASASASLGRTASEFLDLYANVVEIELEGGHIYTPPAVAGLLDPGNRPSGAIHVPWLGNDDELIVFSAKTARGATLGYGTNHAIGDGATITDISPTESAVDYGPLRSGFGIRAFDSDATYMAMGASGNDSSADTTDDDHAVFVSDDGGATWTLVLGPTADSSFGAFKGYSAAFAGDSEQVIFIFGASDQIGYTSDFGTAIDSRAGNLSSFGVDGLVGIMGGPTGGA